MADPNINFASFVLSLAATAAVHFGDRLEPGQTEAGPVDLQAAGQMIELIRAYPAAAPVVGDLLARNLDWPGADEIAGRLAALVPRPRVGRRRRSRRPRRNWASWRRRWPPRRRRSRR